MFTAEAGDSTTATFITVGQLSHEAAMYFSSTSTCIKDSHHSWFLPCSHQVDDGEQASGKGNARRVLERIARQCRRVDF